MYSLLFSLLSSLFSLLHSPLPPPPLPPPPLLPLRSQVLHSPYRPIQTRALHLQPLPAAPRRAPQAGVGGEACEALRHGGAEQDDGDVRVSVYVSV